MEVGNFWQERIVKFIRFLCYAVLLMPTIVVVNFLYPFVAPKVFYFLLLVEIASFLWLVLIIFDSRWRPSLNILGWSLLLFLIISILAGVFGVNPARSFWGDQGRGDGIFVLTHFFLFFLILISVFKRKEDWQKLLLFSVFIAAVISLAGLLATVFHTALFPFNLSKFGSTIGNSSFLANYLLFNLFFAIYLFFAKFKPRKHFFLEDRDIKFISALCFLIIFVALALSTGKAAALASLGSLILLALFYLSWQKRLKALAIFSRIALAAALAIVLFIVVDINFYQGIVQNIIFQFTCKARGVVWQTALTGLKERPILGWGPSNFTLLFDKHFPSILYTPGYGAPDIWYDRAHNIIFDTLATRGILGFTSYLLIIFAYFYLLFRYFKKTKDFLISGVFGSLFIAYFLQNLTVFDMPTTYLMLFLIFGFIGSLQQKGNVKVQAMAIRQGVGKFLLIIFLAVLFAFSSFKLIFQPIKTNLYFRTALDAKAPQKRVNLYRKAINSSSIKKSEMVDYVAVFVLNQALDGKASPQEIDYLIQNLRESIKESPLDLELYLDLARLYKIKYQYKKASQILEKGLKVNPWQVQFYWELAKVKKAEGDYVGALQAAKKAMEIEPEAKESW